MFFEVYSNIYIVEVNQYFFEVRPIFLTNLTQVFLQTFQKQQVKLFILLNIFPYHFCKSKHYAGNSCACGISYVRINSSVKLFRFSKEPYRIALN